MSGSAHPTLHTSPGGESSKLEESEVIQLDKGVLALLLSEEPRQLHPTARRATVLISVAGVMMAAIVIWLQVHDGEGERKALEVPEYLATLFFCLVIGLVAPLQALFEAESMRRARRLQRDALLERESRLHRTNVRRQQPQDERHPA